jgi:prolyl 4-hydroxylase
MATPRPIFSNKWHTSIPLYEGSTLLDYQTHSKEGKTDKSHRSSETAWLPVSDPVVSCVRARAAAFQGHPPEGAMEPLAAVRYSPGGRFNMHYDWNGEERRQVDRRTSFFVILEASCTGGQTNFPLVERTVWRDVMDRRWCRFIDCDGGINAQGGAGEKPKGISVKPVAGNALFWVNFRENGTGIPETVHAGLPVLEGTKIGMNIWTYGKMFD